MTYSQAQLIIWNPKAYDRPTVVKAASMILGSMKPSHGDYYQALAVL